MFDPTETKISSDTLVSENSTEASDPDKSSEAAANETNFGRSPRNYGVLHLLGADQLLPPICPLCGAPGLKPFPIPLTALTTERSFRWPRRRSSPLLSFYCDLCADSLQASVTRQFAFRAACVLLSLSATTASVLTWGNRFFFIQLGVAALLPTLIVLILNQILPRRASSGGLFELPAKPTDPHGSRRLMVLAGEFSLALTEHGISKISRNQTPLPRPRRGEVLKLLVALVALVNLIWLLVVHLLGTARVRLLSGGKEDTFLLVDSRMSARISPTNSEDPKAGQFVQILGGNRQITLLNENGSPVADQRVKIWPGNTYIIGRLPPGKCLFWQQYVYKADAGHALITTTRFTPIAAKGHIWRLEHSVDGWFEPLEAPDEPIAGAGARDPGDSRAASSPEIKHFWTSGGVRRAVRLLPCR